MIALPSIHLSYYLPLLTSIEINSTIYLIPRSHLLTLIAISYITIDDFIFITHFICLFTSSIFSISLSTILTLIYPRL